MFLCGTDGLQDKKQAYELLKWAGKTHWGMTCLPAVERLPGGKPRFADENAPHFNLSHSGPYALCALDDQPVGVDIQVVRALRPGLPEKVCSREELAWLAGQPDYWRAFAQIWTLKESLVKQRGGTIIAPGSTLRALPVPLPGEGLLCREGLWFRCWTGPDWAAAVCGLSVPPDGILWRNPEKQAEKCGENYPLQPPEILL